jgi:IS30 family transposase
MARRGRKRQLDLEVEYWRLLGTGIGTAAACRLTGIGRKTGYRWRAESGGVAPVRLAETERHGRYLSLLERRRIAALRAQRMGVREIARAIGRAPSTVSRELRRNLLVHDRNRYDGELAHARARQRARRTRPTVIGLDEALREVIAAKLRSDWSPEQIAAHLRRAYPDRPAWHVCHETIYQALYHCGKSGLVRTLTQKLRTGRSLRYSRRRTDRREVRFVTPSDLIDKRPAAVEERTRVGDWEGDLIVGALNRSAIGTLVDRTSRYVRLIHLPGGHRAGELRQAIEPVLAGLPAAGRLTLTWDQGTEMAHHHEFAASFSQGIYFANPGSPWLRGTNENTNGLLRQYFPKGSNLRVYTPQDLAEVEHRLNNRPRKILDWQTPMEVFNELLTH